MDQRLTMPRGLLGDLLWAAIFIASVFTPSYGFDDQETHPRITDLAVVASKLDLTLKTNLGITNGKDAILQPASGLPRSVLEWLLDGSTAEDSPACRASNHFHNPTKAFAEGGVTDRVLEQFLACSATPYNQRYANATWSTRYTTPTTPGSPTGNADDWEAARGAYYLAWTQPTKVQRDAKLAETFLKLGRVLHLVQDLAVPAHVRNDFGSHFDYCYPRIFPPKPVTSWCENAFERYVRGHPEVVTSGAAVAASPNERVVRFWDTGAYRQSQSPSAGLAQGLAEYTSANFLSLNTTQMDTREPTDHYYFPHPSEASTTLSQLFPQRLLVRQVQAEDNVVDTGLYIDRTGAGERVAPLAKVGYLAGDLIKKENPGLKLPLTLQLDETVHAAYAGHLLPKAIAYSAGLLDYFFRGKLDFELKAGGGTDGQMGLVITNTSAEEMDGTFSLYAEDAEENQGENPEVSVSLTLAPGQASTTVTYTPTRRVKKYVLAFQGRLGTEAGAVGGKVEPYDLPPAIPIQHSATLTGEEQTWGGPGGTPGYSVNNGTAHSRSGGQQRAQGVFFPAYLGKYLQRIELTFETPPDPTKNEVVLKINGTDVGTAWSRDTHPQIEPQQWEVVLNIDASSATKPPHRLVAEAGSGARISTPFLWWRSVWTYRSHVVERQGCVAIGGCMTADYLQWRIQAEVGFGDAEAWWDGYFPLANPHTAVGFIPLTGIAGYPVGSYEESQVESSFPLCVAGPYVGKSVGVFAIGSYWQKNRADVLVVEGQSTPGACSELTLPETLPADPAPPFPALQFQRDYKDSERVRFSQLGIETPPAHVISLE